MDGWSFEPILDSYAVVLIAVGGLVALTLISRPSQKANPSRRRRHQILVGLRLLLILLLMLAMLRPTRVLTESQPQSATLLVLVDVSRSMGVEDQAEGKSRWAVLKRTLNDSAASLRKLNELVEVRAFGFDGTLRDGIYDEGEWRLPDRVNGEQTDLASALRNAIQREAGKRIAGVVLLTDGSQRVYQPKFDVQQAVSDLKRLNAPLFTVPFGKPRDQTQARDVAIEQLNDQYTVFVKNEVEIRGAIRVQGYVNRPIPISVEVQGPNGATQQTLGPIQVTATADDQLVDFQFGFAPQDPGAYTLQVVVQKQDGELVLSNNQMTAYLTALDGGIRVLFLEGNLFSPEAQVLRWSLGSFQDIELDFRVIDPRQRGTPVPLDDLLDRQPYDIVILGDVDADAIGTDNLKRFAAMVTQRGAGLLMMGGVNTLASGGYRDSPIDPLLPMQIGQFDRQEFGPDRPIRQDLHLKGPLTMRPVQGRRHFITQLGTSNAASQQAWQRLSQIELAGANRLDRLRANAIRLAETPGGDPLLVAREFAPGRLLVLAVDSTHRWWRYGQQALHKRFWRQAMLWLAGQDEVTRRDVWIQMDRRRYRPGELVIFQTGAKSESGEVLTDAQLSANFRPKDGNPKPITLTRDGDAWTGSLPSLEDPGEYIVEVEAKEGGAIIGNATARFQLEDIDLELADPAANPQQLAMLSAMTSESGGRSLPAEQFSELVEELLAKPPEMKIEVRSKWRFGDRSIDAWPFFVAFVGILSSDWFLRKRWGLM